METYALIFLIVVAAIYAISIRIVTGQRYKEIEEEYGLYGDYMDVEVEDKYYIPSIVGAVIVVAWFFILKDPYQPIRDLTPSSATSGWLWATTAAFLACIPIGMTIGFLFLFIEDARPESERMGYIVVISGIVSVVIQAMLLFKIYNPWLIWLPMCCSGSLVLVVKKWLPGELEEKGASSSSDSWTTSSSSYESSGYASGYSQPSRSESRSRTSSSSSRSESDSDRLSRQAEADEYYYKYQQYRDEAERLMSEAESYDRWADDNEYWARESNDSFKASEARRDRERASRLRYQSREAERKADRYYNLYQQCRR